MTEVSEYGEIANGIQLPSQIDASDDEDENQEDQIRQRLQDNLPEFSFGDDASDCSDNESRCSSVNQNNNSNYGFHPDIGRRELSTKHNGTSLNGSYASSNGSFHNGLNLNELPNSIMDHAENVVYPNNGNGYSPSFTSILAGHGRLNGNLVNGAAKPKKQVTILEHYQNNRGHDEIEASNPTISLLHQEHCPQGENGGRVDSDYNQEEISNEDKMQSMNVLLETRQRQLDRSQEEVMKLQKDKRSLNHEVGLMKTEINNMKRQNEEVSNLLSLKEQELEYVRSKLSDAISAFEGAKASEESAIDKLAEMDSEIAKLRDEIKMLSSIGSAQHKAELTDVVQQLREKHAKEMIAWKGIVSELEGQLRAYKRQQGLLANESYQAPSESVNAACQTEDVVVEYISDKKKTRLSFIKDDENGDLLIKEKNIISLRERLQEMEKRVHDEKVHMQEVFEVEIQQYRERLAALPAELYRKWEEKQAELGLQAYLDSKPLCVDAFTSIDKDDYPDVEESDSIKDDTIKDNAAVQVNFPSPILNGNAIVSETDQGRRNSSVMVQTTEKETSSVVIQTDETSETYKVLNAVLNSWTQELQAARANEAECIDKCKGYEEELTKLKKNFKMLHKVATKCRKESKIKEEKLNAEIDTLKTRQIEVLKQLNEKLNVLA